MRCKTDFLTSFEKYHLVTFVGCGSNTVIIQLFQIHTHHQTSSLGVIVVHTNGYLLFWLSNIFSIFL